MNIKLMQRIAIHDLHERIEDMAELAVYRCHRDTMDATEEISAAVSFEIRSIAQRSRWMKFNEINRRAK